MRICWRGHDSFEIISSITIWIDPYKIDMYEEKADLLLITHPHFDHLSIEDIEKIVKDDTVIVIPRDEEAKKKLQGYSLVELGPGEETVVKGVHIKAVPAYNVGKEFHPKQKNWNGYIITIEGKKVYHAGDTDFVPEMNSLRADIFLVPVSGTYVMDREEAVRAVKAINPEIAIPMHYGEIVGSIEDAQYLRSELGEKIVILERNRCIEI